MLVGDDLRRQIAGSLGETLSNELGVSSTYFSPTASRPIIRGLGGYRVQTLQDGLASLDVSGLSQDHSVTLESVVSQQIEVIKGPAALLYGSGAAGGLVNVVTNGIPMSLPDHAVTGAAELRGATADNERTGAVSLDGGLGAIALHADYFKRKTDDVEIPGFAQSDALRRSLIEAGEEPDDVCGHIPNTDSDTRGGAFGASYIGASARGGLSWSRYNSTYGIPGEATAFIDMKQDRIDAKGHFDLHGFFTALKRSQKAFWSGLPGSMYSRAIPRCSANAFSTARSYRCDACLMITVLSAVAADLWLCNEGVFQPRDRAGDLRFGGLSRHRRQHPDHNTIASVRERFLPQIESLFVEVLKLAWQRFTSRR